MDGSKSQRREPADLPGAPQVTRDDDAALQRIGTALQGLRYGSVLAIVQDGVVIQIERTEKTRLEKMPARKNRGR
jgi:hypothetical protein